MLDVLKFWLERGVDGFRVDAIHHLFEDAELRDNPVNREWRAGMSPARRLIRLRTTDQPEVHDAIRQMRRVADQYKDRLLIGEAYLPIDRLMAYYGVGLAGFQLPFNFHLISAPWKPAAIAGLIELYEQSLPSGGWPNWVLGNHDRSRVATRLGRDQAGVAAMLLLTLRGTPTIYQGEELGMQDAPISPNQVHDPWERNVPGLGLRRDPVRSPMPWSGEPHGGFSAVEPWLPIDLEGTASCERQHGDPASMLSLYQSLLRLRRNEPALSVGSYRSIAYTDHVLVYQRQHRGRKFQIVLNMSASPQPLPPQTDGGKVIMSTSGVVSRAKGRLGPNEGLVQLIP
jgi:alpha-glucosidase